MKKLFTTLVTACVISIAASAQSGVKHILLEEFSTAPCGFCPDGDIIAQQIIDNYPQVIWVTHHAGFGTDSMTVPESITIANAFTNFAPGSCIDRGDYPIPVYTNPPYIAISRQKWDSVVVAHLNDPPVVDVLINNNYNDVTRTLTCTVDANFLSTPASGDLRLNLFLMEDSVVGFGSGYDQTNYFNTTVGHPYHNAGNPIVGYVHHHVLRKVVTGTWGLSGIISNAPVAGNTFSHTFSNIAIPTNWKDDDITVIAFVSYYNTNTHLREVLNSNIVDLKSTPTALHETTQRQPFVSPNPANNYFKIDFNNIGKNSYVELFNAEGRLVKHIDASQTSALEITTHDLPNGIYTCNMVNDGIFFSKQKIVILH